MSSIKAREEGKLRNPVVNATPVTHTKPSGSGPNYNRYDQERFAKDKNSKYLLGNIQNLNKILTLQFFLLLQIPKDLESIQWVRITV